MQHDLGLCSSERFFQRVKIAHVADDGVHVCEACLREQVFRRRLEAVARDVGARVEQDAAEPAAFEARMTRDEDALAAIEFQDVQSFHTFHGAWPVFHSVSSCIFSRIVSMHCQKPWCW